MNLVLTGGLPKASLLQQAAPGVPHHGMLQQLHHSTQQVHPTHHHHAGTHATLLNPGSSLLNGAQGPLVSGGNVIPGGPPLLFAAAAAAAAAHSPPAPPPHHHFQLMRPLVQRQSLIPGGMNPLFQHGLIQPGQQYLLPGGGLIDHHDLFGSPRLLAPLHSPGGLVVGKRGWDDAFGGGGMLEHHVLGVPSPKRWMGGGGIGAGAGAHQHHMAAAHHAAVAAAAAAAALNGGGGGNVTTGSLVGGFNIGSTSGGRLGGR